MKNQKDYSKLDGVLKVLLILFISLLSFSTGVYAGKKFSEKQYDLVSLNDKDYAKEKFPSHASEEEEGDETELPLSQKEIESLSEESVKIAQAEEQNGGTNKKVATPSPTDEAARSIASADAHSAIHSDETHGAKVEKTHDNGKMAAANHEKKVSAVEAAHAAHPASAAHNTDSIQPSSAALRVANDKTPSQNIAPKTQPHSLNLPQGVGTQIIEYTVQVGSYPTETEAKKHANDLTAKGFPSFTIPAEIKGHTWYRVSVGSFKTAEDANQYKSELVQKAAVKSAYVQKITK